MTYSCRVHCDIIIHIYGGKCMRYTWIDEYLLNKPGVTKDLKKEWNWIRYQIGEKMFAAV